MPKPLNIDWGAARALYVAGVEPNRIASDMGIDVKSLHKRADRGKWQEERELVKTLPKGHRVQGKGIQPLDESLSKIVEIVHNTLESHKKQFLESGAKVSSVGMRKLSERIDSAESLDDLSDIAAVADSFTKTAKPVFGLNDQQTTSQVQVNFLSEIPVDQAFTRIESIPKQIEE